MVISPQCNAQTPPGVPNTGTPVFAQHVPASEPEERAVPARASLLTPEKEKVRVCQVSGTKQREDPLNDTLKAGTWILLLRRERG